MQGGKRYYVIENKSTGEYLMDGDPITGYEETMKFDAYKDAEDKLFELEEDEVIDSINDYAIISLRW